MLKAVILIGGPSEGFRPLSLQLPKPLVPVAGHPLLYHHIKALSEIPELEEVIIIGSFPLDLMWKQFISKTTYVFKVNIRFLQEFTALGTAGGLYHFRDQISSGSPTELFVINSDVCGDLPLQDMLKKHRERGGGYTVLGTEATREQSLNYGCIVEEIETGKIVHFVDKPETFISSTISCGIYLFDLSIFEHLQTAFTQNSLNNMYSARRMVGDAPNEIISMERDVLPVLTACGRLHVQHMQGFWSQLKTAGAVIYANRHLLALYREANDSRLATACEHGPRIIGDVLIHPTAHVHPSAVLGPNVTIDKHAVVGEGVRVRESLVMQEACIKAHSCVLYTLLGSGSLVGEWTRLEGLPEDPNPNRPYAKLDVRDLFDDSGKINSTVCVVGHRVTIGKEVIVRNSIIMPDKEVHGNVTNKIVL